MREQERKDNLTALIEYLEKVQAEIEAGKL